VRARSPSRVVSKPAPRRPEPRQRARAARARVVCRERRRRCERGADAVVSSDRPRRGDGADAGRRGGSRRWVAYGSQSRNYEIRTERKRGVTNRRKTRRARTMSPRRKRKADGHGGVVRLSFAPRARHWPRARRTHTPRGASFAMTIIQYLAALLAVGALLAYLVRPPPARARLAPPRPPRARAREEEATLAPAIQRSTVQRSAARSSAADAAPSPVRSQAQRVYKIAITLMVRFAPSRARRSRAATRSPARSRARTGARPPVSPVGRRTRNWPRRASCCDPARVR